MTSDMNGDELASHIPDSSPRYHLYLYKHTHEGDYQEAVGKEWPLGRALAHLHGCSVREVVLVVYISGTPKFLVAVQTLHESFRILMI